jgi:cytidine deaminase
MTPILSDIGRHFYAGYEVTIAKKGNNSTREYYRGCCYGCHAEVSAMKKLPPNKNKKRKIINLLVIRVNNGGNLRNSKPCAKCIEKLGRIPGYKVKNVYYSNKTGDIVMEKYNSLANSTNKHVSGRFRNK